MKAVRLASLFLLLLYFCGGNPAAAAWLNNAWGYRKSITLNATNVAGALTNFPILISRTDSDLQGHALASGYDLVFTTSDGTNKLSHELDSYSNGAVTAWVKVPYLAAASNTVLYLYYGNAAAANQQNGKGVWDANYSVVWHLNESGSGSSQEYKDATSNARAARGRGGIPDLTSGKFGNGQLFNGTSDYLEGESNLGITGNSARTLSFWVKLNSSTGSAVGGWGNANNNESFIAGAFGNSWTLVGNGTGNNWTGIAAASTGSWQFHTIVHNGSTARWYVNGTEIGSGYNHTYATTDGKVLLGTATYVGTTYYLNGVLDEVRISNLARSTNWIRTEYANQNSPATFCTFGTEEVQGAKASSALALSVSTNLLPKGADLVLTAVVTAVSPATGTPTGAVQFRSDGVVLGSPAALNGGIARLTNSSLSHGAHDISAEFDGDANFVGSTNSLGVPVIVNTAPVAGADHLARCSPSGVKVRIASLLANDSDPDADVISFLTFDATTKAGTMSSNSGWLIYTPTAGYSGADSFSYIIADTGNLQSAGEVTIALESPVNASANLVASETLPDGQRAVRLRGIPGRTYTIEFSARPESAAWQALTKLTATRRGELEFTDTSTSAAANFYRASIP